MRLLLALFSTLFFQNTYAQTQDLRYQKINMYSPEQLQAFDEVVIPEEGTMELIVVGVGGRDGGTEVELPAGVRWAVQAIAAKSGQKKKLVVQKLFMTVPSRDELAHEIDSFAENVIPTESQIFYPYTSDLTEQNVKTRDLFRLENFKQSLKMKLGLLDSFKWDMFCLRKGPPGRCLMAEWVIPSKAYSVGSFRQRINLAASSALVSSSFLWLSFYVLLPQMQNWFGSGAIDLKYAELLPSAQFTAALLFNSALAFVSMFNIKRINSFKTQGEIPYGKLTESGNGPLLNRPFSKKIFVGVHTFFSVIFNWSIYSILEYGTNNAFLDWYHPFLVAISDGLFGYWIEKSEVMRDVNSKVLKREIEDYQESLQTREQKLRQTLDKNRSLSLQLEIFEQKLGSAENTELIHQSIAQVNEQIDELRPLIKTMESEIKVLQKKSHKASKRMKREVAQMNSGYLLLNTFIRPLASVMALAFGISMDINLQNANLLEITQYLGSISLPFLGTGLIKKAVDYASQNRRIKSANDGIPGGGPIGDKFRKQIKRAVNSRKKTCSEFFIVLRALPKG